MRVEAESVVKLSTLLDAAQMEPVFIDRGQRELAVVLSARQYQQMRRVAIDDFNRFCDQVSERVIADGLTEDGLSELLSDD